MRWRHGVYHHNTPFFLPLLRMESIFFLLWVYLNYICYFSFSFGSSVLEPFVVSELRMCRTPYPLGLPLEDCSRRYSNTASLFGSGSFYRWTLGYVYHVSNLFVHCTCLPVGLAALKYAEENVFRQFWTVFKSLCLYVQVLIGLVRICQTLSWPSLQTLPLLASWQMESIYKLEKIAAWFYRATGQMSRVFANGPGDRSSIPGRVIPKTQKWYLMPPCLAL